jgi:hypothetical protein
MMRLHVYPFFLLPTSSCSTITRLHTNFHPLHYPYILLSSHTLKATFLGLAKDYKAFKVFHRPTRQEKYSRDVIFDEGGTNTHVVTENDDATVTQEDGTCVFIALPGVWS